MNRGDRSPALHPDRHWHIIGAGAIGNLFAHTLAASGLSVSLVLRAPEAVAATLTLEREGERINRQFAITAAAAATPIQQLLVTTKAYDVSGAIASVRHRLRPGASVVLLVNGLGFGEAAAQLAPAATLYQATTTEGVFRRSRWHACHAGRGQTLVGAALGGPVPPWFAAWEQFDSHCTWHPDIAQALWHKLAINCAINPLTAVHRCRNGELGQRPELAAQVRELCAEIAAVSTAAGFTDTAASIENAVFEVIANTADNRSSMLQDVLANRPTEIDFITGHLVAKGRLLGLPTPANLALLQQLRQLSQSG